MTECANHSNRRFKQSTIVFWRNRAHLLLGALALFPIPASMAGSPPTLTLARPQDAARFSVTTYATGLAFPSSMIRLDDGSILVASSDGSNLFTSTSGRLVRLQDSNHDGVADGPATVLASGLPGLITSMRQTGNLVMALSSENGNQAITLLTKGASPADALTVAGKIKFSFPSGFLHTIYAVAARPSPSDSATTELYFNLGSEFNNLPTTPGKTVGISGADGISLTSPNLNPGSIYRIKLQQSGSGITVSAPEQIATGLRNAAGIAFARNGDLIFQDNGIDTPPPGNGDIALSADELNRIEAGQIASNVFDFGFPNTYTNAVSGATVCLLGTPCPPTGVTTPAIAFLPKDGRRSEGAVEVSLAPTAFGTDFVSGFFVSFFGKTFGAGPTNDENPVVFADPYTGNYFHFINNQLLGHPYGLLATDDTLYLSDLSFTGHAFLDVDNVPANQAGVIYAIRSLQTTASVPGPLPVAGLGILYTWSRRIRRRRSLLPSRPGE